MDKLNELGEKLKVGGADLGRRMTEGVNMVSEKMKELLFQPATPADKLVEDVTADTPGGGEPDWHGFLEICDAINSGRVSGQDVARALKKRFVGATANPNAQLLVLTLLESCVKNCEKMFSEVAAEKVLDDMVRAIDDPQTATPIRDKALKLIESWGESTEELRYLPVYEQTYKSLRSRGIRFPGRDVESLAPIFTPPQSFPTVAVNDRSSEGVDWLQQSVDPSTAVDVKETLDTARNCMDLLSTVLTSSPPQEALKDDLTSTLVEQCRQSQKSVQRIVERAGDDETQLFEALNVHEDLQKVLSKYDEMVKASDKSIQSRQSLEPALIPAGVIDEEPAVIEAGEEKLVRNQGSKKPPVFRSMHEDDAAIADLDEMIFGQKATSSSGPVKGKTDDLITL